MAAYGTDMQKHLELAIPVILIVLVVLVVGAKVGGVCPPIIGDFLCGSEMTSTLIITNPADKDAADTFANDINSKVTRIRPQVEDNIQHIKPGFITSNNYDLVVLFGDNTALTYDARAELADYLSTGGTLMIVKGAGLHGLQADGVTKSPYIFNWAVGDLASYIKFSPDCGTIGTCSSVSTITVTPDEMAQLTLTPVQWTHPIIERWGLNSPRDIDINTYPGFTGTVRVMDEQNKKIAYLQWRDAENNQQSTAAVIIYDAGTGGRVVYLAFNPLELELEEMFREIILYATKATS